ncbi:MAG: hypothetical protein WCV93_03615 [Candidatus Shapirobacteria bacterium]|jgi:hypothetical protein
MSKRLKYVILSLILSLGFIFFVGLPYESRQYGVLVGLTLTVFCFWFGLGLIFSTDYWLRLWVVLLPLLLFLGFGMFVSLLGLEWWWNLGLTAIYGVINYFVFLAENVFMVALGFKTVPLYRAAYTISLVVLLLASFFLFNTILSYRWPFWINMLAVGGVGVVIFAYHFWSVAIELPDDGKDIEKWPFLLVPSWLLAELSLIFSFWPLGIFKGSMYLVVAIYLFSGLIWAEIRGRLFNKNWLMAAWMAGAALLSLLLVVEW